MTKPDTSSYYAAWQEKEHANTFDLRASMTLAELKRDYDGFNEFQLLAKHKDAIGAGDMVEIGCATGELSRYIKAVHPQLRYHGFDISQPGIERARKKFPKDDFQLTSPSFDVVKAQKFTPKLVWCRDVLQHQPEPFVGLDRILQLGAPHTIMRIRSRDKGATVADPELSCQWHYDHWVPYIIVNIDEVVSFIQKSIPVDRIEIVKRYEQLGGWHGRFVPKDCYLPETGTAETAIYIARAKPATQPRGELVVTAKDDRPTAGPIWRRGVSYLRRRGFRMS